MHPANSLGKLLEVLGRERVGLNFGPESEHSALQVREVRERGRFLVCKGRLESWLLLEDQLPAQLGHQPCHLQWVANLMNVRHSQNLCPPSPRSSGPASPAPTSEASWPWVPDWPRQRPWQRPRQR